VRATLVVVLIAVATGLMTVPAVVLARALAPDAVLGVSGSLGGADVSNEVDPATLVIMGVAAALAVVQAVLLIMPAFLIGVGRRVRELAVLAAAGARSGDLRRVVLAPALICGSLGAMLGAAAACLFVLLVVPVGSQRELASALLAALLAALVGTGVAAAAAWYPAVRAVRTDPSRALSGAPASGPAPAPAGWVGASGVVVIVSGAGLAVLAVPQQAPAAVVGGVVLVEVGLVLLAAAGLGVLDRVRTTAAVTAYVLRDAARHRVRVLPAMTASLAVVASVTASLSYQATLHDAERATYSGSSLPSDARTQIVLVGAGVVAVLLVTWVTAALAAQEAQAELETLEILGAAPGTRRRIVAAQAGLVAVGGTVCGIPAGLALGALAVQYQASQVISGGRPAPELAVPWGVVALLAVAVPLVVAGLAGLTARTEVRLTRHVDR
jgi:putative ABC transport system permease protein